MTADTIVRIYSMTAGDLGGDDDAARARPVFPG